MKNERELFEEQPDIKAILQSGFQFNKYLNQYYHLDHTSHRLNYAFLMGAWFAWQASASREGYKLVPVNPTDEMINTYRDKSIAPISTLSVIGYKAMIGAIE